MLPDFIIIGTMKAGTTSLHHYLGLHPEIGVSRPKELNFFIEERNWRRGVPWYERHFPRRGRVRGEASPNYSAYPFFTGAPEHMHEVVPGAKLLYVLREPIERMLSHYVHVVSDGRETRPAEEALLDADRNAYLARSRYHMQLQRFLRYYPADRLLLLTREELRDQRRPALRRVFRFLGVDESFSSPRFHGMRHHTRDKRLRTPMGRALYHLPRAIGLDRLARDAAYHLGYVLSFPFSRAIPRPVLNPAVREELAARLADDLAQLRGAFMNNPHTEPAVRLPAWLEE